MRKHFFNENYFEEIDTNEKAYWLGFISADGGISRASSYNSYRLKISLSSKDRNHLQLFLNAIKACDTVIHDIVSSDGFCNDKGTPLSYISLNSYKMCMDLKKYGVVPNKTHLMKFPSLPKEFLADYIRGFIDRDGSFHYHYDLKNKRYRFSFEIVGANKDYIESLNSIFHLNNINTHIYIRSSNHNYRLMSGSKKEICKIINWIYDNPSVYLKRKYIITQQILVAA